MLSLTIRHGADRDFKAEGPEAAVLAAYAAFCAVPRGDQREVIRQAMELIERAEQTVALDDLPAVRHVPPVPVSTVSTGQTIEATIRAMLRDGKPSLFGRIVEEISIRHGCTRTWARAEVNRLERSGVVRKRGMGRGLMVVLVPESQHEEVGT